MTDLRYTLLSDGPSDRALLPVLRWLLLENSVRRAIQPQHADFRHLPRPPRGLPERIAMAIELYPCDLLFIHRDAERESLEHREAEIQRSLQQVAQSMAHPPIISVIPIRMHESWLLFDEAAIRMAAEKPNGREPIDMPPLHTLEKIADPKAKLRALLQQASGLSGRRLDRLPLSSHRVADLIDDFAPLRRLSAFQKLERDVAQAVQQHGW
jgi:hypothetical protein